MTIQVGESRRTLTTLYIRSEGTHRQKSLPTEKSKKKLQMVPEKPNVNTKTSHSLNLYYDSAPLGKCKNWVCWSITKYERLS